MKSVNIIGAGNVGYHLAAALKQAGIEVLVVYNRTLSKAQHLAEQVGAFATDEIKDLPNADLQILSVTDDAIELVADSLFENKKVIPIVHTSGNVDISVFKDKFLKYGCLWPLQSMVSGENISYKKMPLCLDASNNEFLNELELLCEKISEIVIHLPSEKKQYYHLAAVFANNFSNHMFLQAEKICHDNDLDFKTLLPLIEQSIQKLKCFHPKEIQTGPARRNDVSSIRKHQKLIKDKDTKRLYKTITKSIISTYHADR